MLSKIIYFSLVHHNEMKARRVNERTKNFVTPLYNISISLKEQYPFNNYSNSPTMFHSQPVIIVHPQTNHIGTDMQPQTSSRRVFSLLPSLLPSTRSARFSTSSGTSRSSPLCSRAIRCSHTMRCSHSKRCSHTVRCAHTPHPSSARRRRGGALMYPAWGCDDEVR